MGWDDDFAAAFLKSQIGAGVELPKKGNVFVSLKQGDKALIIDAVKDLVALGFNITATDGTAAYFEERGVATRIVRKVIEGQPNIVDAMINGEIDIVMNTTEGMQSRIDSKSIRRTALMRNIPIFTTLSASLAAVKAIRYQLESTLTVRALQDR